MGSITVTSERIAAVIEPERGASVSRLGWADDPAHNVLAEYDWEAPLSVLDGPGYGDSALDWLSDYRGGWQMLTPNAGDECIVDGIVHPVHGETSRARWRVVEATPAHVTMRTATHGPLSVERTIEAVDARLEVTTTLTNRSGVDGWAILVEHVAFAGGDDAVVRAPESSRWSADTDDATPAPWPDSPYSTPALPAQSRVGILTAGNDGWIEFDRPALGYRARLTWDPQVLPYLWQWYDRGSPGFPWFGRSEIVGLEPSSSSRSSGLAAARERGEAWRIAPNGSLVVPFQIELYAL